ncbi:MAG: Biopolymer transport protein ExbD/TolR [Gemmatimonadetes bacterium]|nr:Biopolymer transport protein ExbD/TolR [Gemmatimonadota bacterium]
MARHRRERLALNSEINVVSLIDVMLILLVIFMITAPMMQGGVDIALPRAEAKPLESKSGLVVTVDRAGAITMDGTHMSLSEFRSAFRSLAGARTRDGVYLRGDAGVPFGVVAQALAIMNAAGVSDIGLVLEPEAPK